MPSKSPVHDLERIVVNSYENVYWFARMFVESDRYGGVGRNSALLLNVSDLISKVVPQADDSTEIEKARSIVLAGVLSFFKNKTKARSMAERLCSDLKPMLERRIDFLVLALTLKHIVHPINEMLHRIPDSDTEFAESVIEAYLATKGEQGVKDVINLWDQLGVRGCLAAERAEVVTGLCILRNTIQALDEMTEQDKDHILSAYVQEFERRVGQKRKGRAGRSLEDVTGYILKFFEIPGIRDAPEHLRTSLEMDKLVKCSDGNFIGIACKRTFRERWKQQITTDLSILDKLKVKALWHVITYDRDLSDDKIREIGNFRGVLYLADDSQRFTSAREDTSIRNYIRPLSHFVDDLRNETVGS
jgi:hypothetical protein